VSFKNFLDLNLQSGRPAVELKYRIEIISKCTNTNSQHQQRNSLEKYSIPSNPKRKRRLEGSGGS
jgi:hypothetical protein